MTNGYAKEYIDESCEVLGEALDYIANSCGMDIAAFLDMFIASGYAKRFEECDPSVVLGISGTELSCKTLERCGLALVFPQPEQEFSDGSFEYWMGYYLAGLKWYSDRSFKDLIKDVPMDEFEKYIPELVGGEDDKREKIFDRILKKTGGKARLQIIRNECGYSQRELAERSGVNIRTLQQYESKAKDINKAAVSTLMALSRTLGCKMTDIMEY